MDIILIVVVATIGGADDFVSIVEFAEAKEDWFRDRLGLKLTNGIPSHDTLNRVFAIITPTQFQKCFIGWIGAMSDRLKLKQIPIDGKAMRGSKRKTEDRCWLSDRSDRQCMGVGERCHAGSGADR